MAADSRALLVEAMIAALKADPAVGALIGDRIYDTQPARGAKMPYSAFGEVSGGPWDTKTEDGMEVTVTLNTFSQSESSQEVRLVQAAISDVLDDAALSIAGHDVVDVLLLFVTNFPDPEASTQQGVQRFRAWTEQQ